MVITIPNTGSQISMGKVYHAYFNVTPTTGANISLRATLGAQIGVIAGAISLSSAFGGRTGPFDYA
jgi:predicted nuclease with TOPRIM domain